MRLFSEIGVIFICKAEDRSFVMRVNLFRGRSFGVIRFFVIIVLRDFILVVRFFRGLASESEKYIGFN